VVAGEAVGWGFAPGLGDGGHGELPLGARAARGSARG
jgi:hypothetical protein